MVHLDHGTLFSTKKKFALKPWKTWRILKYILLIMRWQFEKATFCMIPTMWHSGNGKTMETVKRSVAARVWGEGGMSRLNTEDFYGSETTLYNTIMVDIYHYTFIHTRRIYSTKNEPYVNYGLWVIMFVNVGSSIVTNLSLCWKMLIMGQAMHEWAQGINGKSLYLSPSVLLWT